MKAEKDRKKIVEFFDLIENDKYDLRKYSKPSLVYFVDTDGMVKFSLWENDDLEKYGLVNVDGWDFEEDLAFCPDWVSDTENDDDDYDDDDDL
jgi:hypothetical protein